MRPVGVEEFGHDRTPGTAEPGERPAEGDEDVRRSRSVTEAQRREERTRVRGRSKLEPHFDPDRTRAQVRWEQIVVGTLEAEDRPSPERVGQDYHLAITKTVDDSLRSGNRLAQAADQRPNGRLALGIGIADQKGHARPLGNRRSPPPNDQRQRPRDGWQAGTAVHRGQSAPSKPLIVTPYQLGIGTVVRDVGVMAAGLKTGIQERSRKAVEETGTIDGQVLSLEGRPAGLELRDIGGAAVMRWTQELGDGRGPFPVPAREKLTRNFTNQARVRVFGLYPVRGEVTINLDAAVRFGAAGGISHGPRTAAG